MGFLNIFTRFFAKKSKNISPEIIESLPEADDASFYRDSRRLLQRFDEFITVSEAECESLSIELDHTLAMQDSLKEQLKVLNKPKSWHERHLLLKLNRLQLHGNNLKQRIEIYSQNIKIYLNLISKIQDIKAMRMNGLDEDKIETIWLEFKQTLEQYRDRVSAEESGFNAETITTTTLENELASLRKEITGDTTYEDAIKEVESIQPAENNIQKREPIELHLVPGSSDEPSTNEKELE